MLRKALIKFTTTYTLYNDTHLTLSDTYTVGTVPYYINECAVCVLASLNNRGCTTYNVPRYQNDVFPKMWPRITTGRIQTRPVVSPLQDEQGGRCTSIGGAARREEVQTSPIARPSRFVAHLIYGKPGLRQCSSQPPELVALSLLVNVSLPWLSRQGFRTGRRRQSRTFYFQPQVQVRYYRC